MNPGKPLKPTLFPAYHTFSDSLGLQRFLLATPNIINQEYIPHTIPWGHVVQLTGLFFLPLFPEAIISLFHLKTRPLQLLWTA